ncbi:MAG: DNA recombination protein RmuC, partial [Oscillospiraceae bacterium]|nr:DNA recombination protein RmuC [Oscillospiraceae bacterium]
MTDKYIFYIIIALLVINVILSLAKLLKKDKSAQLERQIKTLGDELEEYTDKSKKDTLDFLARQQTLQNQNRQSVQLMEEARFKAFSDTTQDNIDTLRKTVNEMAAGLDGRFAKFQKQNEEQLSEMRKTLEQKVSDMQQSNEKKLDEMRQTVDEKLQKTLEERINQSFKLVSDRLEQVYKSLGEMQKVGEGVNDLRKVLSNVKTRGIFGEVQLGAILEEILSPEQYEANIATKKNSADRVEFAVKLPGYDDGYVYLPIDAKFPLDAYQKLQDAYDSGDRELLVAARKELRLRIKGFAKDIRTKYIDVPNTTEFAIMFLPLEGLYAEVVREGMVEELQKDKINIAGPTTMAALLNSLQMGFRTLAIRKRTGEVWNVLGAVKTEFDKFGDVLDA